MRAAAGEGTENTPGYTVASLGICPPRMQAAGKKVGLRSTQPGFPYPPPAASLAIFYRVCTLPGD